MSERDIFIAALQKEDLAERAAYLDQATAGNLPLRQRIEVLLKSHAEAGSFLEKPAIDPAATGAYTRPVDEPVPNPSGAGCQPATQARQVGDLPHSPELNLGGAGCQPATEARQVGHLPHGPSSRIGPYKLLQEIGEGGMGTVYMAEQQEPVRRLVALKIIKAGMDSREVVARFQAERQALALMDHPNIAKVLDAGTTSTGRLFFVMELVKGIPITKYCDEHRLTPRQRLELFMPVCHALQHAHQKGIIHRDIKPSNVLVAPYDGKPVIKVIDFGVAKATGQRLTEKTMFTEFGAVIGTLEYMSPEQAELNNQDIDTRSDIYSLGVLLYELLTGTTPLDRTRLKKAAFTEMLRIIREEEPPRPSMRLSGSNELPSISAQRQTEPSKLSKLMRGELDWIVMKSLEKDRVRRYETANGLARDIERYLKDEAVEACPPSAAYRLRKFLRRNKGVATAGAVVMGTLLVGVVIATWGMLEARREQLVAEDARRLEAEQRILAEAHEAKAKGAQYEAVRSAKQEAAARQKAEESEGRARYQLLRAETANYAMWLKEARAAIERFDIRGAEQSFAQLGKEFEDTWERRHVWQLFNAKARRIDLGQFLYTQNSNIGGPYGLNQVGFSPDGGRFAAPASYEEIQIADGRSGQKLLAWKAHKKAGKDNESGITFRMALAFNCDGKQLISGGSDGVVRIWDADTGEKRGELTGHGAPVRTVTLSFDGKWAASAAKDKAVKIWDVATGKCLHTFAGQEGVAQSIAFSQDGKLFAWSGEDGLLRLWDLQTGNENWQSKAPAGSGALQTLVFSPDSKLIFSFGVSSLKAWHADTGEVKHLSEVPIGFATSRLVLSADGRFLAVGTVGGMVVLWDAATGAEKARLPHQDARSSHVLSVAITGPGPVISSVAGQSKIEWDLGAKSHKVFASDERKSITSMALTRSGNQLVTASWGAGCLWETQTGQQKLRFKADAVAISSDGKRFATASFVPNKKAPGYDSVIQVWETATGKPIHTLATVPGQSRSLAFSPDGGRLAAGSWDDKLRIWDVASGKQLFALVSKGADSFQNLVFSHDGARILAYAGGLRSIGKPRGATRMWEVNTGMELLGLESLSLAVSSPFSLSNDGRTMACAAEPNKAFVHENEIWLLDAETGTILKKLVGRVGRIEALVFSPDGKRLFSGGSDNKVRVWNLVTYQEVFTIDGHEASIPAVAMNDAGDRLFSASYDGTVRVWEAPLGKIEKQGAK